MRGTLNSLAVCITIASIPLTPRFNAISDASFALVDSRSVKFMVSIARISFFTLLASFVEPVLRFIAATTSIKTI